MSFFYTFFSYLGASFLFGLICGFVYAFDKKFFTGIVAGFLITLLAAIIASNEPLVSANEGSDFSWAKFLGMIGLFLGFHTGEYVFNSAFKDKTQ